MYTFFLFCCVSVFPTSHAFLRFIMRPYTAYTSSASPLSLRCRSKVTQKRIHSSKHNTDSRFWGEEGGDLKRTLFLSTYAGLMLSVPLWNLILVHRSTLCRNNSTTTKRTLRENERERKKKERAIFFLRSGVVTFHISTSLESKVDSISLGFSSD